MADVTEVVDAVAVNVPANAEEGHVHVVAEVAKYGNVVHKNETEDHGVGQEAGRWGGL